MQRQEDELARATLLVQQLLAEVTAGNLAGAAQRTQPILFTLTAMITKLQISAGQVGTLQHQNQQLMAALAIDHDKFVSLQTRFDAQEETIRKQREQIDSLLNQVSVLLERITSLDTTIRDQRQIIDVCLSSLPLHHVL